MAFETDAAQAAWDSLRHAHTNVKTTIKRFQQLDELTEADRELTIAEIGQVTYKLNHLRAGLELGRRRR